MPFGLSNFAMPKKALQKKQEMVSICLWLNWSSLFPSLCKATASGVNSGEDSEGASSCPPYITKDNNGKNQSQ